MSLWLQRCTVANLPVFTFSSEPVSKNMTVFVLNTVKQKRVSMGNQHTEVHTHGRAESQSDRSLQHADTRGQKGVQKDT